MDKTRWSTEPVINRFDPQWKLLRHFRHLRSFCAPAAGEKMSFSRLSKSFPFSRFFRQFEQDAETVVRVLQPGPLGIVEHNFSAEEISEANIVVRRAVVTWRTNADLDKRNPVLRDYIET